MILTHFDGTIQEKGLGARKTKLSGNLGGCCQWAQLLVCSPRFPCFVWHVYSHLNISYGLVEIAPHFITTKLSSPLELDGTWQNLFSSVTSGFFHQPARCNIHWAKAKRRQWRWRRLTWHGWWSPMTPMAFAWSPKTRDGRLWQTDGWWLCKRNQREPTLKRELLVEFRVYGEVWSLTEIVYSVWVEKRIFSGIRVFFPPTQSRSTGHHFWALITSECFLVLSCAGGEYLRPWEGCCNDDSGQWHGANVTAQWAFQGRWKHVKHVKHVKRVWLKSAEWLSKLGKRVLLLRWAKLPKIGKIW